MRAIITPATPGIGEDLIERLLESHVEVVALVRRNDRPAGQEWHIDLLVYGTGMLSPTELRRRMRDCDVVYQDIYSFADLDPLPDEDDVFKVAWAGGRPATFARQRPGAIVEDVYIAPDAVIRMHLWASGPAPAEGARRELAGPYVHDPALGLDLGPSMLDVTLLVPPRVSRMQEGLVLTGSEPVGLVFAELLQYWASLRLARAAGPKRS